MLPIKICPLLLACPADIPTQCREKYCAWFYGDRCAILEMAMNSGDIQTLADSIDFLAQK